MWNRPQLMSSISDLLFLAGAAALLVAGAVWAARLPLFPLQEVVITQELSELRRDELEYTLAGHLKGNFFSVNLDALRASLEQLPWVRRADARRQWPGRMEVSIEEHLPVAFWGAATGQLVNQYGEVFTATLSKPPANPLPVLTGPAGLAAEMLADFQQAETVLHTVGRWPKALNLSPRLALQLRLDDGMVVELGRQQAKAPVFQRLTRFVEHYPELLAVGGKRPAAVDMRYPNGFALRFAAASANEGKGKP